jgi:hypothetical protein
LLILAYIEQKRTESAKNFMKSDGTVDFSKLKYDLSELFNETPLFDVPPLNFALNEDRIVDYKTICISPKDKHFDK